MEELKNHINMAPKIKIIKFKKEPKKEWIPQVQIIGFNL